MSQLYFKLSPSGDEMIRPDEAWAASALKPITCPMCGDMLSEFRSSPLDIQIQWDGYPEHMILILHHSLPVIAIRNDLYAALQDSLASFAIGEVSYTPATELLAGFSYHSVIVPSHLRCLYCSANSSDFSSCPGCGRQVGSPADDEYWLDSDMVGDAPIVSPPHGGPLLLSLQRLEALPFAIRSELMLEASLVAPCP